jgi:hypothetical protein
MHLLKNSNAFSVGNIIYQPRGLRTALNTSSAEAFTNIEVEKFLLILISLNYKTRIAL